MKAIRHIGLVVKDLDKAISFYRDILGLKIIKENAEKSKYIDDLLNLNNVVVKTVKMSAKSGDLLELLYFERNSKEPRDRYIYEPGYSHMAFTVENLDVEYKRLRENGVNFKSKPLISPDGKAKVVFCSDPEGNAIELVEEKNG